MTTTIRELAADYRMQPFAVADALDLGLDYDETADIDAATAETYRQALDQMAADYEDAHTTILRHVTEDEPGYDTGWVIEHNGQWVADVTDFDGDFDGAQRIARERGFARAAAIGGNIDGVGGDAAHYSGLAMLQRGGDVATRSTEWQLTNTRGRG